MSSANRHWLTTLRVWSHQAASFLFSGKRQRVITAVFFTLTLLVITSILYTNRELLRSYEWHIQPYWLVLAIGLMLISMYMGAWAWHRLVADVANVTDRRLNIKIWWYANLAKRLPGVVWYIASRAILYEQAGVAKRTVTLLSGLEIALMFVSGLITTLLTLPFWVLPDEISQNLGYAWFMLVLIPLSLLLIHPRVLEKILAKLSSDKEATPGSLILNWHHTLIWLVMYMVIWVAGGLILFSTINFFQTLSPQQLVPVVGMWSLANSVSLAGAITVTNIGVREVSLALLLTQIMPLPVAIITIIAIRLILLAGGLITAVIALKLQITTLAD